MSDNLKVFLGVLLGMLVGCPLVLALVRWALEG
jgi:hypothetical protein